MQQSKLEIYMITNNQSINQPTNQSINQSTDQLINQLNQSIPRSNFEHGVTFPVVVIVVVYVDVYAFRGAIPLLARSDARIRLR